MIQLHRIQEKLKKNKEKLLIPSTREQIDLNAERLCETIPLGRFAAPEEIAQAALFLAQNQYAHNCVVNLDGGLSAV